MAVGRICVFGLIDSRERLFGEQNRALLDTIRVNWHQRTSGFPDAI